MTDTRERAALRGFEILSGWEGRRPRLLRACQTEGQARERGGQRLHVSRRRPGRAQPLTAEEREGERQDPRPGRGTDAHRQLSLEKGARQHAERRHSTTQRRQERIRQP